MEAAPACGSATSHPWPDAASWQLRVPKNQSETRDLVRVGPIAIGHVAIYGLQCARSCVHSYLCKILQVVILIELNMIGSLGSARAVLARSPACIGSQLGMASVALTRAISSIPKAMSQPKVCT